MLSIIVISYALLNLGMYTYQEKLLFFPGKRDIENCPASDLLHLKYQENEFNGQKVRFLKKDNSSQTDLIVFHGNAGTVCNRFDFAQKIKSANIYLYEYPGYGKNNNDEITQKTLYKNAQAFMDQYIKNNKDHKTYLYGESLGTGVATTMAARYPKVSKLFLQSPYTSITDVAFDKYPFMPVSLLIKNPFNQIKKAKNVKAHTYVFYGSKDKIINPQITKEQFKNFKAQKKIFKYPGFGHNLRYQNSKIWKDLKASLGEKN